MPDIACHDYLQESSIHLGRADAVTGVSRLGGDRRDRTPLRLSFYDCSGAPGLSLGRCGARVG